MIVTKTTVHSNPEGGQKEYQYQKQKYCWGEREFELSNRNFYRIFCPKIDEECHIAKVLQRVVQSSSNRVLDLLRVNCSTNLEVEGAKQSLTLGLFFSTPSSLLQARTPIPTVTFLVSPLGLRVPSYESFGQYFFSCSLIDSSEISMTS